jgi:5'-nucleotidase
MRILLTNDDGINSPGLWRAAAALREVGEVFVCAPDREQSGVGTAVSLQSPIRAAAVAPQVEGVTAFAVEGTPADSAILGLECLVGGKVDLVVAGINVGANLGEDVLGSGTVAASLQGHFRGIPAMAVSVTSLTDLHYEPAAALTGHLARALLEVRAPANADVGATSGEGASEDPRPLLLNINLPNLPLGEMRGVVVTRLGRRAYADTVKQGNDGRRRWFWIARDRPVLEQVEGTDIWAVQRGFVSITPLATDLTGDVASAWLRETAQRWEASLGRR